MNDESIADIKLTERDDDDTLGGPEVTDVSEALDAEDFDFDAFVEGVRPGRRAVRVTMRADLVAELDRLATRAQSLGDDDAEADELLARFDEVKHQILDSQRTFIVEARSDARGKSIVKQLEKLGYPKPGKKADEDAAEKWNTEAAIHRLADAIVVPSNVSVEGLRKLNDRAESEINKLFGAFMDVCTNPTKGVTAPFSQRR